MNTYFLNFFESNFFQQVVLGNTILNYLSFLSVLLIGILVKKFLSKILAQITFRLLKKYSTGVGFDKFLELLKAPFGLFVVLVSVFFAFELLDFPKELGLADRHEFGLKMIFSIGFQVLIVISLTWILLRITDFFGEILSYRASLTESKVDDQLVPFVKESIKVIIAIFSLFFILGSIFEINIASLIAGLGIGGLAIALAAKESLENLLGSFTIFLDKPFLVGDLVQIGSITGHVEKIGFRSTRIRTLEKSFITVPNKKLVEAELDNLSLRTFRRVKFTIAIGYNNSTSQVKNFSDAILEELQQMPNISNDRQVRLYELGKNSLEILIIYFIETLDYDNYLEVREKVNFKIMELAEKNQINFAFTNPFYVQIKNTDTQMSSNK